MKRDKKKKKRWKSEREANVLFIKVEVIKKKKNNSDARKSREKYILVRFEEGLRKRWKSEKEENFMLRKVEVIKRQK